MLLSLEGSSRAVFKTRGIWRHGQVWLRPFLLRTANLTKELPQTHGLEIEACFGATPTGACGGGFNATLPL